MSKNLKTEPDCHLPVLALRVLFLHLVLRLVLLFRHRLVLLINLHLASSYSLTSPLSCDSCASSSSPSFSASSSSFSSSSFFQDDACWAISTSEAAGAAEGGFFGVVGG